MALLSKKDFAALANKTTKELAVYISRRKVVVDVVTGMIDPAHETNRAYLAKFGGVQEPKPIKKVQEQRRVVDPDEETDPDDDSEELDAEGLMSITKSDKMKNHYEAIRKQKMVELAELELAKKQGIVIPSELIKPVFRQHNQSILTEMRNSVDDFIRTVAHQFDISADKVAEYKGKSINALNEAMERAKKSTAKAIVGIVENYTESK